MATKSKTNKSKTSLGARLARSRRRAKLSRQDAAKRLGLAANDIRNIENERFDLLPDGVSVRETLRHYSLLLGENPAEFERLEAKSEQPTDKKLIALSKTTSSLLVLLLMVAVGSFLIWRIIIALALPTLSIHQPTQGQSVSVPTIVVSGQSSEQAQVFVNDVDVPLNPDGSWSTQVILAPGPNDIRIVAINSFGRQNSQSRTVIYHTE